MGNIKYKFSSLVQNAIKQQNEFQFIELGLFILTIYVSLQHLHQMLVTN